MAHGVAYISLSAGAVAYINILVGDVAYISAPAGAVACINLFAHGVAYVAYIGLPALVAA